MAELSIQFTFSQNNQLHIGEPNKWNLFHRSVFPTRETIRVAKALGRKCYGMQKSVGILRPIKEVTFSFGASKSGNCH